MLQSNKSSFYSEFKYYLKMVISISEKKGFASSDICEPPTLTVIAYKELE